MNESEKLLDGTPFRVSIFEDQERFYHHGLSHVVDLVDFGDSHEAFAFVNRAIERSYRGSNTPNIGSLYTFVGMGCNSSNHWTNERAIIDHAIMTDLCIVGGRLAKKAGKDHKPFYDKATMALTELSDYVQIVHEIRGRGTQVPDANNFIEPYERRRKIIEVEYE
jgi:hypothetical protein